MNHVLIIAGFALRESLRQRVFVVVALLTLAFLVPLRARHLADLAGDPTSGPVDEGIEGDVVAGATLLGLSMFATLFLGAILAVFLTLGAVRGDAERGLLQPMIVRPLSRGTFLLGRFVAAGERVRGVRDRRVPRLRGDHERVHRLVAGPADRAGARARRRRWR